MVLAWTLCPRCPRWNHVWSHSQEARTFFFFCFRFPSSFRPNSSGCVLDWDCYSVRLKCPAHWKTKQNKQCVIALPPPHTHVKLNFSSKIEEQTLVHVRDFVHAFSNNTKRNFTGFLFKKKKKIYILSCFTFRTPMWPWSKLKFMKLVRTGGGCYYLKVERLCVHIFHEIFLHQSLVRLGNPSVIGLGNFTFLRPSNLTHPPSHLPLWHHRVEKKKKKASA